MASPNRKNSQSSVQTTLYGNLTPEFSQQESVEAVPTEEKSVLWEGAKGAGRTAVGAAAVGAAGYGGWKLVKWTGGKLKSAGSATGKGIAGVARWMGKTWPGRIVTGAAVIGGTYSAYDTYQEKSKAEAIQKKNAAITQVRQQNITDLTAEIRNLDTDEYRSALVYAQAKTPNITERKVLGELIKDPTKLYAEEMQKAGFRFPIDMNGSEDVKKEKYLQYEKAFREKMLQEHNQRLKDKRDKRASRFAVNEDSASVSDTLAKVSQSEVTTEESNNLLATTHSKQMS